MIEHEYTWRLDAKSMRKQDGGDIGEVDTDLPQ